MQETGYAFQIQFKKRLETGQVPDKYRTSSGQVPVKFKLLHFCQGPRAIKEMMAFFQFKHRETFLKNYIHPLIEEALLTMTIPDKPKSSKQKYLITPKGFEDLKKSSERTG